jgi:hypothetical protein
MKQLICACLLSAGCFGQYAEQLSSTYNRFPSLPRGILEAVAFTNTRLQEIPTDESPSCSGMPLPYGIMGVFANGAGYFRENGKFIARLSGITVSQQQQSSQQAIDAWAIAFLHGWNEYWEAFPKTSEEEALYHSLRELSEIPDSGAVNRFAQDLQMHQYLSFLTKAEHAQAFGFPLRNFDLNKVFGKENLKVLEAKRVHVETGEIRNNEGKEYHTPLRSGTKSLQYAPALWNPAPTCNFSSRNGIAVSAITIHTVQGSYAGAISWAQNCNSNVSYHYVVRSSDGQITQLVHEEDKAWHVASENPYTIGYEHEGYVSNPAWFTEALYWHSADLSRDIVNSGYGINPLRTYDGQSSSTGQVLGGCLKIKGHQHYPNQTHTDPGIHWNWEKYYRLINDAPAPTVVGSTSGTLHDSGGPNGPYSNDERQLWLIQPPNATSVSIQFQSFSLENAFDRLYVYDGNTLQAPLIGMFTGNSLPAAINSTGGSLLLEFRSDCGTTADGWSLQFSSILSDNTVPQTQVVNSSSWKTQSFTAAISDTDAGGNLMHRFYLVADKEQPQGAFHANGQRGFAYEDFNADADNWTVQAAAFSVSNGAWVCNDAASANTNAYLPIAQSNQSVYLYRWKQRITSTGTNQRAGLHFFCSDPSLPNRGNSYFVYLREGQNKAQIYSVDNDVYTLQADDTLVIQSGMTYAVSVRFNPGNGLISLYVNDALVSSWQDPTPLSSGNSVSFRSAGCTVAFDELKCFKSRNGNVFVELGEDLRYQSISGSEAGQMIAFSLDSAHHFSSADSTGFKVDWTLPELAFMHDGMSNDLDTLNTPTIASNWLASDPHSGIVQQEIAIGHLPYDTTVLDWTSVVNAQNYWHNDPQAVPGDSYFTSLWMLNGAGLENTGCSDGTVYHPISALTEQSVLDGFFVVNPIENMLMVHGLPLHTQVMLIDAAGRTVLKSEMHSEETNAFPVSLSSGCYILIAFLPDGRRFCRRVVREP